ncbi:MAG TPA: hypothetical protein VI197_02115 [Polyangiaceae bacterium]
MSAQHDFPKREQITPAPPVAWSKWPAMLERLAQLRGANARASPRRGAWSARAWRALEGWSARIEREPKRAYGVGAALAFVFGVLMGLL